jgi:excisionase family DNA binding protein
MQVDLTVLRDMITSLEFQSGSTPDLTIQDVAGIKRVSPRTVRRWIAEGRLPAHRSGKRLVRIKPQDLEQLDRPIPTT